jgi:large subunit ribosomal protein L17
MRHGDKINNLSRTASHRKALLTNLSCQLFQYKKIVTTLAKAKALRTFVEPLITKSKDNTTHSRRLVFSRLQDKEAIKELFDVISPKIAARPGGYTRIIKLGTRVGDNAELAMIELVDFNEIYGNGIGEADKAAKKTRRAGRTKKAATPKVETTAVADKSVEKEAVTEKAAEEKGADDLTIIEGIGPKVSEVLHAAGITSFAQLAASNAEDIKEILEKSGGNFNAQDPTTWAEQAQLAADGKMDELNDLKEKLNAGRGE